MRKITLLLAAAALFLTGCRVEDIQQTDAKQIEYTVTAKADLPEEVGELLEEKKEQEFQLTYEADGWLYIMKGYGKQKTGGYSVQVKDVSENDTTIFFTAELLGPKEKDPKKEVSYPCVVIKLEARDKSVQFQ